MKCAFFSYHLEPEKCDGHNEQPLDFLLLVLEVEILLFPVEVESEHASKFLFVCFITISLIQLFRI